MPTEFHIKATAQAKAVDALATETQCSRQFIKQAMSKGAVWLQKQGRVQRLRKASTILTAGEELFFYYDQKVLTSTPPTPELIADRGAYSVWHKPTGMLSQGSKWGDHCALPRWVEAHHRFEQGSNQRNGFLVHRLDKAAQGLMLVAHSKKAARQLSALFETRQLDKRYRALVNGRFTETPVDCQEPIDGKSAHSIISRLSYQQQLDQSLLEIRIFTGRKHQIRAHLSGLGFPILGDRLYGGGNAQNSDLKLCAHSLAFQCPVEDTAAQFTVNHPLDFDLP